jgi:ElaB/YqjD/DUF883 family membrane-anchored ribosome-binding protein
VGKIVTDKDLEGIKANVQQGLKVLTNELDKRLADLRKQVQEVRLGVNNSPRSKQMLRLGVAFAIGLAVGVALSRRDR